MNSSCHKRRSLRILLLFFYLEPAQCVRLGVEGMPEACAAPQDQYEHPRRRDATNLFERARWSGLAIEDQQAISTKLDKMVGGPVHEDDHDDVFWSCWGEALALADQPPTRVPHHTGSAAVCKRVNVIEDLCADAIV